MDIISVRATVFCPQPEYTKQNKDMLLSLFNGYSPIWWLNEPIPEGKNEPSPSSVLEWGCKNDRDRTQIVLHSQTIDVIMGLGGDYSFNRLLKCATKCSDMICSIMEHFQLKTIRFALAPTCCFIAMPGVKKNIVEEYLADKKFKDTSFVSFNYSLSLQGFVKLNEHINHKVNYVVSTSNGEKTTMSANGPQRQSCTICEFDVNTVNENIEYNVDTVKDFFKSIPEETDKFIQYIQNLNGNIG